MISDGVRCELEYIARQADRVEDVVAKAEAYLQRQYPGYDFTWHDHAEIYHYGLGYVRGCFEMLAQQRESLRCTCWKCIGLAEDPYADDDS